MISNYLIKYCKDTTIKDIRSNKFHKKIERLLRTAKEANVFFDVIEYKPNLFMVAVPNESNKCLSSIPIKRVIHLINGLWLMGAELRKWRLSKETTIYTPLPRETKTLKQKKPIFWNEHKKRPGHTNYFNNNENYKLNEVAQMLSMSYSAVHHIIERNIDEVVLGKIKGSIILEGKTLNKLFPKTKTSKTQDI